MAFRTSTFNPESRPVHRFISGEAEPLVGTAQTPGNSYSFRQACLKRRGAYNLPSFAG